MSITKRATAEFFGTFWLVFGGCGSAVLAAAFPNLGIGFLGVAFAFGLTLLTMAFTIGPISGCHINPAVSIGLWAGKRFPASDLLPYIVAQVAGGIVASSVLYVIASGKEGFTLAAGFASNGYGEHSPGGYSLLACLLTEVVLTMFFLLIIIGSTDERAPKGFAPNRDWAEPHPDSPHFDSGDEYLGEPRPQHGAGSVCEGVGAGTVMAVLVSPNCGRHLSGAHLPRVVQRGSTRNGSRRRERALTAKREPIGRAAS